MKPTIKVIIKHQCAIKEAVEHLNSTLEKAAKDNVYSDIEVQEVAVKGVGQVSLIEVDM